MSVALLDVNVLVALFWASHAQHPAAMKWFALNAKDGWATCPLTEAGLVRVLSNPKAHSMAPSASRAIELLKASTESHPQHEFWMDEIPVGGIPVVIRQRIQGHQQINDAYLLALAIHHKGVLVTFDSGMGSLAPSGSAESRSLLVLKP